MNAHRRKLILLILTVLLITVILSSCSTLSYYRQSVQGHLSLMSQRESIADLIASQDTPEEKKQLLERVLKIRAYATDQLGLPDNDSYTSYVELDRDYVVWNVVATPEFSMAPKTWCFPVAGCVSYRGYYAHSNAEKYADQLKNSIENYDVAISGATAYSTLGWFDDPVLSSMSDRGDILLAETIFHELAHQVLYLKKDSAFNEAFATAAAVAGVRQWLQDTSPDQINAYHKYLDRRLQFFQLIDKYSSKLKLHYDQNLPDVDKREGKMQIISELKNEYSQIKNTWDGFNGYDLWFGQDLNNANLSMISTYWKQVPVFEDWLKACDQNLSDFFQVMKELTDKKQRLSDDLGAIKPEC